MRPLLPPFSVAIEKLICPSKYRPPNILDYRLGDLAKKNLNEEKIIKFLKEAEGDITARNICWKHQTIEQTFYRRRNKFDSMTVFEVRCLKEFEHDNAQLK